MVAIKGKGDIPHKWEDQIPKFKTFNKKRYELYLTYIKETEAKIGEAVLIQAAKLMHTKIECKVVPVRINSSGYFTVYSLYMHK
jgi:hypothetical protein